jgi:uncharacterized protein YjbI with pentapeptide repeats
MANPEHLELARQGRDAWNKWRRRNPDLPADFSRADFTAPELSKISLAGFELGPKADFAHCVFGGADHRAVATQDLSPYAPEVAHYLSGGAWFYGARFGPGASFAGCTFKGVAVFQSALFGRDANFQGAAFLDEANFVGAQFGAGANFAGAIFAKLMQFERTRFAGPVTFESGPAGASRPTGVDAIPYLTFRHARFGGPASFAQRRFLDRADFAYAVFNQPPNFAGVGGRDRVDFQGTRFRLREGLIPGWTTRAGTVAAIRQLRGIARDADAHAAERDLLVLERKAERGTAWKNAYDAVWAEPLRKLGLYGRALSATVLLFLYGVFSDCGRGVVRPVLWLALVNAAAYFAYRTYAKPSTTVVGRAARGTWGWMKSLFVTPPPSATTSASLSADQQRSLFEFWWSGAVPGSVTRSAYEKSVLALFGPEGVPPLVYFLQFGQAALNLLLVLLLAVSVRNHFRGATP